MIRTIPLLFISVFSLPAFAVQFSEGNRWTETATDGAIAARGDGITLTWGIVPDGTPSVRGQPSNFIAALDSVYGSGPGGNDLTQRPWFADIQSVFDRYSGKLGVRYVYEPHDDGLPHTVDGQLGVRPDVRITALAPFPFPALGVNNGPNNGGDMTMNSSGAGNPNGFFNNINSLTGIMMHEHAHGLGLGHTKPGCSQPGCSQPGCCLPPTVVQGGGFNGNGPQYDDLLGLHRLYGDALELDGGNDTLGTATNLGSMAIGDGRLRGEHMRDFTVGRTETDILSIDGDTDADVFAFNVTQRAQANIFVRPVGPTYNISNAGQPEITIEGKRQADLKYEVFRSDGLRLFEIDNSGLGLNENYAGMRMDPGQYFVRVSANNDANQFYEIQLQINNTASPIDPNLILQDRFTLSANPTAFGVNSNRLQAGRQRDGLSETLYSERSSGITSATLDGGQVLMTATGRGSAGPSRHFLDLARNFAPELDGELWAMTFDVELMGSGSVNDGWFSLTFNDDVPVGAPFSASAELSLLLRESGQLIARSNNGDDLNTFGSLGTGPYSFEFIVDETGLGDVMSLSVNGNLVFSDEAIDLTNFGRHFGLALHNGGTSAVDSVFSARLDNLEIRIVPEPSMAMVLLVPFLLWGRSRRA